MSIFVLKTSTLTKVTCTTDAVRLTFRSTRSWTFRNTLVSVGTAAAAPPPVLAAQFVDSMTASGIDNKHWSGGGCVRYFTAVVCNLTIPRRGVEWGRSGWGSEGEGEGVHYLLCMQPKRPSSPLPTSRLVAKRLLVCVAHHEERVCCHE